MINKSKSNDPCIPSDVPYIDPSNTFKEVEAFLVNWYKNAKFLANFDIGLDPAIENFVTIVNMDFNTDDIESGVNVSFSVAGLDIRSKWEITHSFELLASKLMRETKAISKTNTPMIKNVEIKTLMENAVNFLLIKNYTNDYNFGVTEESANYNIYPMLSDPYITFMIKGDVALEVRYSRSSKGFILSRYQDGYGWVQKQEWTLEEFRETFGNINFTELMKENNI